MGAPPAAPRLALLALLLAASEPRPNSPGDPKVLGPPWRRSSQEPPLLNSHPPMKEHLSPFGETPRPGGNTSVGQAPSLQPARAKESQLVPPALPPMRLRTPAWEPKTQPVLCPGCSRRTVREMVGSDSHPGPGAEASSAAPRMAPPGQAEDGTWRLFDRGKAGPGSQEDVGSGDPHAKTPLNLGWATPIPPRGFNPEGDLLLEPTQSMRDPQATETTRGAGSIPGPKEDPSSRSPKLETLPSVAPPAVKSVQTPSSDPLASEIIDVDYYDLFDGEALRGPGVDSTKAKPPVDKGVSWPFRDLYDEFSPFDESDFYPTTSFYTDGDEEEEPEEEEEEEEEEEAGAAVEEEEGKDPHVPTPTPPKTHSKLPGAEPTARRFLLPPLQTFVVLGAGGRTISGPVSGDLARETGTPENSTECRIGYTRHNATCKSVCDTFPSYCHNGGQCYLVENLGAFCRCNTQDYIWHKGLRCESIVTDFQVMCVAVGSAALVVLLLFMMTVFFAKKLYLLKTENLKLRKSKYRTPSELHNDNFSLSTIAEGSHPNVRKFCDTPCNHSPHARALAYYDNIICQDDPSALHKLQDPLKSCLKDDEAFNIQNSTSPKLDNRKGHPDDAEVNCLQNNLT
ncbi:chondroitin sulfate proteoglycan 5 [Erythrolamprus reginae]|uniref:chondroitin sulfate proteoglycan 5 n=1 Tax=Erythrolamprus reginae TaxID=121349 RepID=UPI00396C844F